MNVLVEEQSLQDIANAIREKNGSADTYKPSEMGNAVRAIESGGEDLSRFFKTVTFADALEERTENLELNLVNATTIHGLIDYVLINFEKITVTISSLCTSFQNAFRARSVELCGNLKIIEIKGDTSGVTTMINAFNNRVTLEEIIGYLDFTSVAGSVTFANCRNLEEIRVVKNSVKVPLNFGSCSLLSDESIDSLVNGFADMTEQTAIVFTVHKDVKARIEANQTWLSTLTSKNVTLA